MHMTEIENEHYTETVKVNMHIKQLKSWKDTEQQRNAYVIANRQQELMTRWSKCNSVVLAWRE